MKIDLHIHTNYSRDSILEVGKLIKLLEIKKIDIVAITDHNTIEGAIKAKKMWPDKIIIGEEIETQVGEITGLFLNEEIPKNLSLEETIDKIKGQDGIIYIPHPFDRLRTRKLKFNNIPIWKYVDAIEVFNSRSIFDEDNKKALEFAKKNNMYSCCGSDAHTDFEIGNAYMILKEFDTKREFLKNLSKGKIFGKKSSIFFPIFTKIVKVLR